MALLSGGVGGRGHSGIGAWSPLAGSWGVAILSWGRGPSRARSLFTSCREQSGAPSGASQGPCRGRGTARGGGGRGERRARLSGQAELERVHGTPIVPEAGEAEILPTLVLAVKIQML